MDLKNKKMAFLGSGNMANALVQGMVRKHVVPAKAVTATDVSEEVLQKLHQLSGVNTTTDNLDAVTDAAIVVLAVKPQVLKSVIEEIRGVSHLEDKLFISIAAGISTKQLLNWFEKKVPVLRVMPNTPALVGQGMSAVARGETASQAHVDVTKEMLKAVGEVVEVSESQMDAVTGVSGSGPAYGFVMIEAMADAGVQMGLSRDVATTLAAQTLLGASAMVLNTGEHPAQLKAKVTSPAGTTIAGLHALEKGKIRAALIEAVMAATHRSKELSEKN